MENIFIFVAGALLAGVLVGGLLVLRLRESRRMGRLELESELATLGERLKGREEELRRLREELGGAHGALEAARQLAGDLRGLGRTRGLAR